MRDPRRPLWAGLAILAGLGLFVALRFEVTTDLYAFLPEADDRALGALSRRIAQSELSRTMVLTVQGPDTETVVTASRELEAAMRRTPAVARELAFLEGGPPENVERAMWELYEPRRLSFLAPTPEEARTRLTDEGLATSATALVDALAGPMSPLIGRVAPRDPLLVLPQLFEQLGKTTANDMTLRDGRFVTGDGRSSVLFLGTRSSAFDADAQAPFLDALGRCFREVNARHDGRLGLDQSGLNRFATRAASAIKGDIERVSTLSVVLISLLLLALFRSLRLVALASIPMGAGVLVGTATVLVLFGRVHGITVAFGASLIGVSVDYVVHVYCHRALVPEDGHDPFATIGRTLVTGAATTITGFLALAPSSLSGLREVSCFAVSGMIAAFLATRFIVPPLMPHTFPDVPARAWVVARLSRIIASLHGKRGALVVFPLAAAIFVGCVLPSARWNEDFASLGRLDPGIAAEDARVRARVARVEMMRFVVATGATEDEALRASERVHTALLAAREAGELSGHRSVSSLLPSAHTQRAVAAVAYDDGTLRERTTRVFAAAGFATEQLAPFFDTLAAPRPAPLTYASLLRSPLGALVRPYHLETDGGVGFITMLEGVRDADALERRLQGMPNVVFLRQADMFNHAHRLYQRRTLLQLSLGMLAVFAVLMYRYRSARSTLAVLAPSLLSVGVTVSVLTLTGRGIDLVTLTALLFVVSMGDDYGVFLVDALDAKDTRGLDAALLGVLVACLSTLVGFGLLAFSEHPVLSGLGITAASGIAASVVLSPTTLLFLRPDHALERVDS